MRDYYVLMRFEDISIRKLRKHLKDRHDLKSSSHACLIFRARMDYKNLADWTRQHEVKVREALK